jgi:hypothetical protein
MQERHCVICEKAFGETWNHLWDHFDQEGELCYQKIEENLMNDSRMYRNVMTSPDSYVEYFVLEYSNPQIIAGYKTQELKTSQKLS